MSGTCSFAMSIMTTTLKLKDMNKNLLNLLYAAAGTETFLLRSIRISKYNVKFEYFHGFFSVAISSIGRYPENLYFEKFTSFAEMLKWTYRQIEQLNEI